ncbi:MAG: hypothetical protein KAY37_00920 [Phycisphaerae bacterium]|nr:hypothetical protein [Phycisphaerae bacterium]
MTICCDNPDFDGPSNKIAVRGEHTRYLEIEYTGNTLHQALSIAAARRREWHKKNEREKP